MSELTFIGLEVRPVDLGRDAGRAEWQGVELRFSGAHLRTRHLVASEGEALPMAYEVRPTSFGLVGAHATGRDPLPVGDSEPLCPASGSSLPLSS